MYDQKQSTFVAQWKLDRSLVSETSLIDSVLGGIQAVVGSRLAIDTRSGQTDLKNLLPPLIEKSEMRLAQLFEPDTHLKMAGPLILKTL